MHKFNAHIIYYLYKSVESKTLHTSVTKTMFSKFFRSLIAVRKLLMLAVQVHVYRCHVLIYRFAVEKKADTRQRNTEHLLSTFDGYTIVQRGARRFTQTNFSSPPLNVRRLSS